MHGNEIHAVCPHCNTVVTVLPEEFGTRVFCYECRRSFNAPDPEMWARQAASEQAQKKPPWLPAFLLPLLIIAPSVWYGLIKQDATLRVRDEYTREWSPPLEFVGFEAILLGAGGVAFALGVHLMFYW